MISDEKRRQIELVAHHFKMDGRDANNFCQGIHKSLHEFLQAKEDQQKKESWDFALWQIDSLAEMVNRLCVEGKRDLLK